MADSDDVCVLVPTYNEAETIGAVVTGFVDQGYEASSSSSTAGPPTTLRRWRGTRARASWNSRGREGPGGPRGDTAPRRPAVRPDARRRFDLSSGGGRSASRTAARGEAEHVIGNRFADMKPGAMTRLNQVGNRVINRSFSLIHGRNLVDILSGLPGVHARIGEPAPPPGGRVRHRDRDVRRVRQTQRQGPRSSPSPTNPGRRTPRRICGRSATGPTSSSRCTRWPRRTTRCSTSAAWAR